MRFLGSLFMTVLVAAQNYPQSAVEESHQTPQSPTLAAARIAAPDEQPAEKLDHLDLRYRLLQYFDQILVCSPPVVSQRFVQDELAGFSVVQKDTAAFHLILHHLGRQETDRFSDQQKLSILRVYKQLRAARLEPVNDGYKFQTRIFDPAHQLRGATYFQVQGRINGQGQIEVVNRTPIYSPCPRCSRKKFASTRTRSNFPSNQDQR